MRTFATFPDIIVYATPRTLFIISSLQLLPFLLHLFQANSKLIVGAIVLEA